VKAAKQRGTLPLGDNMSWFVNATNVKIQDVPATVEALAIQPMSLNLAPAEMEAQLEVAKEAAIDLVYSGALVADDEGLDVEAGIGHASIFPFRGTRTPATGSFLVGPMTVLQLRSRASILTNL
jgi:hypothetical protein